MPYVGGPILSTFIVKLKGLLRYEDDRILPLDSLSIIVAYLMAKEYKINLNHQFRLDLAAQEWKAWCARPDSLIAAPP